MIPCPPPDARLEDHLVPDSICPADAPGDRVERFPAYRAGLAWLHDFITQPHPELRRAGAVCPFVGPAMRRGLITLGIARPSGATAQDAFDTIAPLRDIFAAMPPTESPARAMKALVVFFPDLPPEAAGTFIDGGHRLLKPHFVDAGQMIGEFHPESTVPGSTNPAFHAMRAPVPAFVIREISPHDTRFIVTAAEEPARQVRYLSRYLEYLGASLPAQQRVVAEGLLAAARERVG